MKTVQFEQVHITRSTNHLRTYWYINGRKISHDIARHTWMMYLHKTGKEITSETMAYLYTCPTYILEAGITTREFVVHSGNKGSYSRR